MTRRSSLQSNNWNAVRFRWVLATVMILLPGTVMVPEQASARQVTPQTDLVVALSCGFDADGDGICDAEEDSDADLDGDPSTNPGPDTDGDTIPNYLDPDDDGDGIPTTSESADPNADGDPRDAVDSNHDGVADYLSAPTLPAGGQVTWFQKISDTAGGFAGTLGFDDQFGMSATAIGDIDGDGVTDIAVGAINDDDGGTDRGAIYILFLNPDGTVKAEQKISDTAGGFSSPLQNTDLFGKAIASIGDLDGDGVNDLAVGAYYADDGGTDRGAVYILFLNPDGTVKAEQEISSTAGGLTGPLDNTDRFGRAVTGLGDLDGDGVRDIAVSAYFDDDGGTDRGAVYILFLNTNGTVKAEQKISSTAGGFTGPLDNTDSLGSGASALGDVDGDGVTDLAVGSYFDDDGGTDRGAVYILFLNTNGTVKAEQKISSTTGGLLGPLDNTDYFGVSTAGVGDFDGDGTPDLLVGAARDDDGGTDRGAIYLLSLSTSGAVESQLKISNTSGGLGAGLDNGDYFGTWVSSLGDLDGDDLPDLVVGVPFDDDGGSDHGAAYVIGLSEPASASVNSTADLGDLVPGDGLCDTGATNSEGADECTLRAAIEETNATASIDIIDFALPLSDPGYVAGPPSYWVIAPASNLPAITDIVTIDGYTQAGSSANTVAAPGGLDTVLKVRLDGTSAVQGIGFNPGADGSVVRGLNIANFASRGIAMAPGVANVEISGNFIGTNIDGTAANSNTIGVFTNGADLRVGSGVAADRNLISGNSDLPVRFSGVGAQGGIVQGNLLGTDVTGMSILAAANWGVMTDNGAGSLTLGVDGDGFDDAGEANIVIAGSNGSSLTGSASVIAGNYFGVGSDGVTALGAVGLGIGGSGTRVGSNWDGTSDSLEANLFSGLVGAGISIAGAADDVSVLGNRFWGNGGLGIDLGGGGVTENDPNDADSGPNGLLNFPEITNAVSSYGSTQIDFDLDVPAGDYRVEAFVNPSGADPSGNGEGEQFAGATVVSHTGSGAESFQVTISGAPGDIVSLTATEQTPGPVFGSTSEFSDVAAAVCADADSDGLCDDNEDANADADNDPATNPGPDTDGDTIPNYLDADDDNDGSPTSTENADPNADGDPRDALDSDFDGQPDWLDVEAGPSTTPLGAEQKISELVGGLTATLTDDGWFGYSISGIGDLDGDGVDDVAVAANRDDDGGTNRGAVFVLFLNADGTVKAEQKISSTEGGLTGPLDNADNFGSALAVVGDLDGDGTQDIVVGASQDDDGGTNRGAAYILFLNTDGTVKAEQKISSTEGGLTGPLDDTEWFGGAVASIGDLDGDGTQDIVVGARYDDDGGTDRGAAYILFLNTDGTVKAEQKISSTTGGLTGPLDDNDRFGGAVASIGDLDGDGTQDIVVGARYDDDGGTDRGAAYILFLNTDGTVKAEQKISSTTGGLTGPLDNNDEFGGAMGGLGDLNGDGTPDLAVAAYADDDGGTDRGAVYLLALNPDGSVKSQEKISSTQGNLAGPLDDGDWFGWPVASLGDLDGDGLLNLAIGATTDDDGGLDRGAIYIVDLSPQTVVAVNSTGDLADLSPGDNVCDTGATTGDGFNECTLRAAIDEANASASIDTIEFDIPAADAGHAAGVWTINPASVLPAITASVTIDGTTQAGAACDPVDGEHTIAVLLDGTGLAASSDGLVLTAGGSTIQGLAVEAFGDNQVQLDGNSNMVRCSFLGVQADGATSTSAESAAVYVTGTDSIIGGPAMADRNVLSTGSDGVVAEAGALRTLIQNNIIGLDMTGTLAIGAFGSGIYANLDTDTTIDSNVISGYWDGIFANGSTGMVIIGNKIGTNRAGTAAVANGAKGVWLLGAADGTLVSNNLISGNTDQGVFTNNSVTNTTITGNTIGMNATGDAPIPNSVGVYLQGPATVGGSLPANRNIISGNTDNAITVVGSFASGTTIEGNRIGTSADGLSAVANGGAGIQVDGGADNVVIGGAAAGTGNLISGNTGHGVHISSSGTDNTVVQGNVIGLDSAGNVLGNANQGIYVAATDGHQIGGSGAGEGNVISGNASNGVMLDGTGATGNVVAGNIVGLDPTGSLPRPNGGAGVAIWTFADGNTIGGATPGDANTISGNTGAGVSIANGADNNMVRGNRIGLDSSGVAVVPNGAAGIGKGGAGAGNTFISNQIVGNVGLGIDLGTTGVDTNDALDVDTGSNDLLNYPVVTSAIDALGTVTVDFDLDVPAGSYRIELFTNPAGADPSGYGEGQGLQVASTIVHTGSGTESFQIIYGGAYGDTITLTATEESAGPVYGSTSEFSAAASVACTDTDGDTVCDIFEDANLDLDGDPSTNPGPDTDGDLTPDYLDTDDDGDGAPTADESADPNADGDPADALDTDADLTPDYLDAVGGADCTAQTQVPTIECNYLVALASATNSPSWTANSGWLAHSLPCLWSGVTCDATNVTGLDLSNSGLVGSIPAGIDDLTALQTIDLSVNRLSGAFPADLAAISTLVELRLNDNELTGSLPLGFGSIASLTVLDVETNRLGGSLPADLGSAAALTELDLGHNQLSGSIPAGLGSLASLVVLDLQNNAFSGSIPTTFGALDALTDLRLQNNVLTGAIPAELGDMASVQWMMLHDNGLSGSIPVELGDATTLQGLSLHGNLLSGAVPVELSNLASLAWLTLQGNAGLGSVPGAVVDLPGLLIFAR